MQTRREFLKKAGRFGLKTGMGLALMTSPIIHPVVKPAYAGQYRFIFEDSEAVVVTFRINSEYIRKVVPEPFRPNKDSLMRVWIARDRRVKPKMLADETLKAFVAIPATYGKVKGLYIDKAYVETIFAASWAQDVYGWPMEYAKITLSRDGSSVKSSITKGDTQIARIDLSLTDAVTPHFEEDVIYFTALGTGQTARKGMTEHSVEEVERLPGQLEQGELFGLKIEELVEAAYIKFNKKMGHSQKITE